MSHEQTLQAFRNLAWDFQGRFQYANMADVLEQVSSHTERLLQDAQGRNTVRRLMRTKTSIRRIFHDIWSWLRDIHIWPQIQVGTRGSIFHETKNIDENTQAIFFRHCHVEGDLQPLYARILPLDFSMIKNFEREQLDVIKQQIADTFDGEMRRAFLLQVMYHAWFDYAKHKPLHPIVSQSGMHISDFSRAFEMWPESVSVYVNWKTNIGEKVLKDIVDFLHHYNSEWNTTGFQRTKNQHHIHWANGITQSNISDIQGISLQHRSRILLWKVWIDIWSIDYDDIGELHYDLYKIIGGDMKKFQWMLTHIAYHLWAEPGNSYGGFGRITWTSRELWNPIYHSERYVNLLLRVLITIVSMRRGDANERSKKIYQETLWAVKERIKGEVTPVERTDVDEAHIWLYERKWARWKKWRQGIEDTSNEIWEPSILGIDYASITSDDEIVWIIPVLWSYCLQHNIEGYKSIFSAILVSMWVQEEHLYVDIKRQMWDPLNLDIRWINEGYITRQKPSLKYLVRLLVLLKDYNNSKKRY